MRPRLRLLTTGPWDAQDGDPGSPATVAGLPVVRVLRTTRGGQAGCDDAV